MSKINPLYEKGDVKFPKGTSQENMLIISQSPVSYRSFYGRLRKGMSLKNAIYTPSNTNMKRPRYNMKPKKKPSLRVRFISFFKKNEKL